MSGRGRGRGRGKSAAPPSVANAPSFVLSSLPSNAVPPPPPPRFPPNQMAVPVDPTEADMPAIRFAEQLRYFMLTSPYNLSDATAYQTRQSILATLSTFYPFDIEIDRYSDKYVSHLKAQDKKGNIHAVVTDLAFFPDELHSIYNHEAALRAQAQTKAQPQKATFLDTLARLQALEQNDACAEGEEGDDPKKLHDVEDEPVYEEEELEDETDYNLSYFDNGEEYGDYDDGDEGPVY